MNIITIYFSNGDILAKNCVDASLQSGFLIVVYSGYSENEQDPISEGFNIKLIDSFEMVRLKGDDEDEGISGEQ